MFEARITDEPTDVVKALTTLGEHVGTLPSGPGLTASLERIVGDGSYRFVLGDDGAGGPVEAAGIVTFMLQPITDEHVLAVEALWLRDDDLDAQLPVWRLLVDVARRMELSGVCLSPKSTNAEVAVRELIERGSLDSYPVTVSSLPLQREGNSEPVHSSFADGPITGSAFISLPSLVVHIRRAVVDLAGREYSGQGPLYRGEGRLERPPHWDCDDLTELARVHFSDGFDARPRLIPAGSSAPFAGTIAEQLLHQGYVGQGAVSLSTSFDVAATYATHAGRRDEALVFTVDAGSLRERTAVFDAGATLAAACPWIPPEGWTPLRRVVTALWGDLAAAGHFLERCYEEAFERARAGAGSLAPPPDPSSYLSADARAAVAGASVDDAELVLVHDVFEEFALFAEQRIGSVDTLLLDADGEYSAETERVAPMAYFEVFARIRGALAEACPEADPAWDMTPFGYVAKTARDDECFAAGSVPGELIVEAHVVDRDGRRGRRLAPT